MWPGRWTAKAPAKGVKTLTCPSEMEGVDSASHGVCLLPKPLSPPASRLPVGHSWAALVGKDGAHNPMSVPLSRLHRTRAQEKAAEQIKTTHKDPCTKPRLVKAGISCYLSRQQLLVHKGQAPTPAGCVAWPGLRAEAGWGRPHMAAGHRPIPWKGCEVNPICSPRTTPPRLASPQAASGLADRPTQCQRRQGPGREHTESEEW